MSQNSSSLLGASEREKLISDIRRARKFASWNSSRGIHEYLNSILIDSSTGPTLYRSVAEGWQWTLVGRLIPALESVAGIHDERLYEGPRNFWFTLPRGHDKTSLIARLCNWLLAYSKRPLRAVTCASDADQAGLILEFGAKEAHLNPWLKERLDFKNKKILGLTNGSRLQALSADASSSYGLTEDVTVIDEITHWTKRALFDTVFSGRQKRPNGVLIIISNAGEFGTWQRDIFELALKSKDWFTYESPGCLASWLPREKIAEDRKMLPPGLGRRLFDNCWVDPTQDSGFTSRADAQACVDDDLLIRSKGEPGLEYIGSIDLGLKHDRTALGIGHLEPGERGRVIVDRLDIMEGRDYPGGVVSIEAVERWMTDQMHNFKPLRSFVIDPYQAMSTIQRFQGEVDIHTFEARGGKSNYELASNLRGLISNQRIAWPKGTGAIFRNGTCHDLVDELSELIIKTTTYGWRLDHERTKHDDRAVCIGQLALHIIQSKSMIEIPSDGTFF